MAKRSSVPSPRMPDDVARSAEALVRAGRFASVDDVLRAGVERLTEEAATTDADAATWQGYLARGAKDPRDMTAAEALACLDSDDPERQRALVAHLHALRADVLGGTIDARPVSQMMADIDAELGVPRQS